MPALHLLAGLSKPALFGLYGALGGLLGALVLAEPLWQAASPPRLPEAGPQLAITASKEVEVLIGRENEFAVQIARAGFNGPVQVRFENAPAGLAIDSLTIPRGATESRAKGIAASSAAAATRTVNVIAEARVEGRLVSAQTSLTSSVIDPTRPQADVLFVLDVTQSMDWAIQGVRDGIGRFAADLRQSRIDFRAGLIAYRDLWDDEPFERLRFGENREQTEVFTADEREFSRVVGRLRADGGGDAPESTLDAIAEASRQPFRRSATKVLMVITDNPPKNLKKPGGQTRPGQIASAEEVREAAAVVKAAGIDFVHLVIHPQHRDVYRPIQESGAGRSRQFELANVVSGSGFDSLLADFGREVVTAARAKAPEQARIADAAEPPAVKGLQSDRGYAKGTEGRLFFAIGIWTAAIAALVCLALLAGQHHYLRGGLPDAGTLAAGFGGGLIVGLFGGIAGQAMFLLAPESSAFAAIVRIVGWTLLGGLAGLGLSYFIPNVKRGHGLAGGAIGGAAGAIGYLLATAIFGDVLGRLVGGLLLGGSIGVMVALVESAFRKAWLEVRYGARETILVNLGPEPVKLGGDARACTVWARGAAPVALRYFIRDGRIICEDAPTRKETVVDDGATQSIGNVTVTVRTGACSAPPSPPPRRPIAPPQPPLDLPPPEEPRVELEPASQPAASVPTRPPLPVPGAKPPVPAAAPRRAEPAAAPIARDADSCPSCGRKSPGRPGQRYCLVCDRTY